MFKLTDTELESKKRINLIRKDANIHIANYFLTYGKSPNKIKIFKSIFLTNLELYSLSLFILRLEIMLELQKRFTLFLRGFYFLKLGFKTWKYLMVVDYRYPLDIMIEKELFSYYLNRPHN
jgi:hypothetical protein